jgi:predicted outer membrane repeat protein
MVTGCKILENHSVGTGGANGGEGGGFWGGGTNGSITNCTFSDNSAGTYGGGIEEEGLPTISGCTLSNNTGQFGGGGMSLDGPTTVSGCIFNYNTATGFTTPFGHHVSGSGGGIEDRWPENTVRDSSFNFNSAELGGGIAALTSLAFAGCTFTSNCAAQGGGIYNSDDGGTLDVRDSTFTGNTASDSGGGLYNLGTATLLNCTLSGNTAGSAGGGIFNGASGTLAVKDSTVLNNIAPSGADIYSLGVLILNDSTVGVIGP